MLKFTLPLEFFYPPWNFWIFVVAFPIPCVIEFGIICCITFLAVVGMNSAAIQGIDRISLTVPLNHMKVASPLITPISKESRAAAYSTPSNLSVAESEKE